MGEVISILDFLASEGSDCNDNDVLIDSFRKLISCWKAEGVDEYFEKSDDVIALSHHVIEMLEITKETPNNEAVLARNVARQAIITIDDYCSSVCASEKNRQGSTH